VGVAHDNLEMISPEVAAKTALRDLKRAGSPARAEGAARYFQAYERLAFFGVDSPTGRRMAAEIRAGAGRDWRLDDARCFAGILITRPELEAKALGIVLLGRFRRDFDPALLTDARRWLEQSCLDWASTDGLCGDVVWPLLIAQPRLRLVLRKWRQSPHLYVRRASAVGLIGLARRGQYLDEAYAAARALASEDHHLIQKAVGWLLREAGKPDPARLERFLRSQGHRLGRTSVRYAIERFPARKRRALLTATKPSRSTARRLR
jgi:3-methyladenine DNA glycosylase AlkD